MAQITEDLARDALARCERGQHPPLTAWETQQLIYAWLERERMRRALHEIAEEWAGAECGEPVYAQEAYAIGLAKRMYTLAVEGLTAPELRAGVELQRKEIDRLKQQLRDEGDRIAELKRAIEAMRVAGGSVEFQMTFDLLYDAERYRFLRRKFAIVGGSDGAEFRALNLPRPTYIAPDPAAELDAAIDASVCRQCGHDNDAHDRQYGCAEDGCDCLTPNVGIEPRR